MGFWSSDSPAGDVSVPVPKNANTVPAGSWRLYIGELFNLRIAEPELTPDQATTLRAWRPPRMDEADVSRNDVGYYNLMDIILREQWIRGMMLRIVRDQLNACHKDNGVNHYENCAHLSELYLKWVRAGYRVRGGKLRSKIDWSHYGRNASSARPPKDAPPNREWFGIDENKKFETPKNP